MSLTGFNTIFW